jgi:hypothetical protein
MNKENKILEIERIKRTLESHLSKYKEHKHNSKHASKKADRDKASKEMISYANRLEQKLYNPLIYNIIDDGNPFQFEGFWSQADFYLPTYIEQIESFLEKLKSTK